MAANSQTASIFGARPLDNEHFQEKDYGHKHKNSVNSVEPPCKQVSVQGGQKTGGLWDLEEQAFHIHYLELKAVLLGLKSLCATIYNRHIRIQSDNTTTVAYVNVIGGTKAADCNDLAQQIWRYCRKREIWLSACHIPGSTSVDADTESRKTNSSTEWSLRPDVFAGINTMWEPFCVDLFASRVNFKVSTYASWKPDPGAKYINAFYMS